MKWICTRRCFHNLVLYRPGDYARFKRPQDGPKDKEGKLRDFAKVEESASIEEAPLTAKSKPGPKVKVNEKDI